MVASVARMRLLVVVNTAVLLLAVVLWGYFGTDNDVEHANGYPILKHIHAIVDPVKLESLSATLGI